MAWDAWRREGAPRYIGGWAPRLGGGASFRRPSPSRRFLGVCGRGLAGWKQRPQLQHNICDFFRKIPMALETCVGKLFGPGSLIGYI
jgi:hypothetical protein